MTVSHSLLFEVFLRHFFPIDGLNVLDFYGFVERAVESPVTLVMYLVIKYTPSVFLIEPLVAYILPYV